MHLLSIVPAFAGLAAALTIPTTLEQRADPAPASVSITGISLAGSGCPASTTGAQAVNDTRVIPMKRQVFVAKSGASNTKVAETRVNCQTAINFNYTAGWQFSVDKADYYGRVGLSYGAEATSKTTYYFAGNTTQVCWPSWAGKKVLTRRRSSPSNITLTVPSTVFTSEMTASTLPPGCGLLAARALSSTSTPRFALRPCRLGRANLRAWRSTTSGDKIEVIWRKCT